MARSRRKAVKKDAGIGRANEDVPPSASSPVALLAILILFVVAGTLACHWPALSANALTFDDQQYLTDNYLVQNPSWASARAFLTEVLKPSTIQGYYQPLSMISLMLDCALDGSP